METMTNQTIANKLIAYMNGHASLAELVDWAETILIDTPLETAEASDVLAYVGAADVDGFPLGWSECQEFLAKLGVTVRVEMMESGP